MRTTRDMTDLGSHAVLIQDAKGRLAQHLTAETFMAFDSATNQWKPFDRPDAWWDARMTQTIDPAWIEFPVEVIWERAVTNETRAAA